MKTKTKTRRGTIIMTITCLILGFFLAQQMKSVATLKSLNLFGNNDLQSLQEQIQNLTLANNELRQRNQTLNENYEKIMQLGTDEEAQLDYYKKEIQNLKLFAGLSTAKGPGIIIDIDRSMSDNDVPASTLLLIVNQLLSYGAYGISINGQRVVSLTSIVGTGTEGNMRILMNGIDITNSEGYQIRVISDSDQMQDFSTFHSSIWESLSAKSITVRFQYPNEVELPALAQDSPAFRTQLLEALEE